MKRSKLRRRYGHASTLGALTVEQVLALQASGHVVFPYPRKGIIVVDGFKRYTASAAALKAAREGLR